MKYAHAAGLFFNTPLALLPAKAEEIRAFWERKLSLEAIDFEGRQQPFAVHYFAEDGSLVAQEAMGDVLNVEMAGPGSSAGGGLVAVIPLYGVMSQRVSMLESMSGGTSTQQFAAAVRDAVNNPQVKAVVIDVASPGGSVYGTDELASEIFAMRDSKPIVAVMNSYGFSAAYYAMSNASEIVVTPGGELGSIGVIAMHVDQSEYNAKEGVKPTMITAGKYKAEGNSHEPLGDEARAEIQAQVDRYYSMFIDAVARGREVTASTVREKYGQGRIFGAKDAVRLGMADRVATLDDTIRRFASGGGRVSRRGSNAEAEQLEVLAEELVLPDDGGAARDRDMLQLDRDRVAVR